MISNHIKERGCRAAGRKPRDVSRTPRGLWARKLPDLSILAKQPGQFAVHGMNAEAMTKVHHGTSASDERHL